MPLRVAFDARLWGRTGIGRYLVELCRALLAADGQIELLLAGLPADQPLLPRADRTPYGFAVYSLGEQLLGRVPLRKTMGRADLLHFPHYNVPLAPPRPYVLTVHDLIQFKLPEQFGLLREAAGWWTLCRAIRSATAVCVPSQSTRRDLLAAMPAYAHKIHVVPEGVSDFFGQAARDQAQRVRGDLGVSRFILSVGARKPYKNWQSLCRAFAQLRSEFPDLWLLSVGERDMPLAVGIRHLGYVTDPLLRDLYQAAECLAMPSLYEGFGLPVLEAMACGCPVVCSRGSSLDEIAGPAITVDPHSPSELAAGLRTILTEPDELRCRRVEAGLRHAAGFTWARTANAMLDLYRMVLRRRSDEGVFCG